MKGNDADISDESQRELAAGVLKQAAEDLRRFHGATSKVERELYLDAHSWVMSDDYSWPFSFPNDLPTIESRARRASAGVGRRPCLRTFRSVGPPL